jgi:hypothetical protein
MGGALSIFCSLVTIESGFNSIIASVPIAVVVYFAAWMVMPGGILSLKAICGDVVFAFKKGKSGRVVSLS